MKYEIKGYRIDRHEREYMVVLKSGGNGVAIIFDGYGRPKCLFHEDELPLKRWMKKLYISKSKRKMAFVSTMLNTSEVFSPKQQKYTKLQTFSIRVNNK